MASTTNQYSPIFHVLCGAFLISFSSVFVKLAHVSPTASGFYRVAFGAIFLFLGVLIKREFNVVGLKQLLLIAFCGLTFALDLFFWHESIFYIGPGLATLLGNFQVFLLAGVGIIFLGESAKLRFLVAIPLAISGIFFIVGGNWENLTVDYKTGIYFGLLTALCYTVFLLTLRKIQQERGQSFFLLLMLVSLASAIYLGLKMAYTGDAFTIPDSQSLLALLGLGLSSQTVGWILIATAMPKIPASLTGLALLLQPTLSFIWDVLIFHRPTDLSNWLGVVITLIAIYMGITGKFASNKIDKELQSETTDL
ncbi:MAG: drug/metabolite transporter (DMT)-like permease [Desulforhopalus sp.]|jgi:drug/metabolite transporter (DMT)-like permease